MYPILFKVFGFPISSFGVMMAIAFLVAAWIVGVRLREYHLDPEHASTILLYAMAGGILGSKIYFAVDMHFRTGQPFMEFLLSRAGITWYGGLIGGILAVVVGTRIHHIPTRLVANCVAIAAPFGQAIGRIGCFLVGDDYGRQTSVPWGIAFPKGSPPIDVPVHPTQLYEMVWLVAVGTLLWRRRKKSPFLFGEYLALAGFGRILIEILRRNPRVALGLTEPQWIGIGMIVLGAAGWLYYRGRPEPVVADAAEAREEVPTR